MKITCKEMYEIESENKFDNILEYPCPHKTRYINRFQSFKNCSTYGNRYETLAERCTKCQKQFVSDQYLVKYKDCHCYNCKNAVETSKYIKMNNKNIKIIDYICAVDSKFKKGICTKFINKNED